jgi:hypothetical protein
MEYIYHLMPKKMYGKILLPLSIMEEKYPKLYKEQIKIYDDRPSLLKKKIPLLDCTWQDILFFSTLNTKLIFTALELLGLLDKDVPDILQFPISILEEDNFCYYQEGKEPFTKITKTKYKEEQKLPLETIKYFINCVKKDEKPLIFSGIKHLLYKGQVDVSKGKIIKYDLLT